MGDTKEQDPESSTSRAASNEFTQSDEKAPVYDDPDFEKKLLRKV